MNKLYDQRKVIDYRDAKQNKNPTYSQRKNMGHIFPSVTTRNVPVLGDTTRSMQQNQYQIHNMRPNPIFPTSHATIKSYANELIELITLITNPDYK